MFGMGVRLMRTVMRPTVSLMVPKYQFSLMNQESTNLVQRSLLTGNLIIHNLREMLEKMNEEVDQDVDRDIKNLTLLNQGTLRMSHIQVC